MHELVFRSEELPAADRFDAWRERINSTHAPLRLESEHAGDFHAHQRLIRLGAVSMWPARFEEMIFVRTPTLIRQSDPEVYHLSLLRDGVARVSWGRQENAYQAGDLHFNDSSRPYQIWTDHGPISSVGVEIPKALLPLPRRTVERAVGRHLSNRTGPGVLLSQFLIQLAADTSPYRPSDAPRLGTVLVDLVAATLAHAVDAAEEQPPETRARVLALRIKELIRQNLHDPELAPSAVAARLHISRGYLHRVFRGEGETVASYMRRKRLEGARRDLVDPALAETPIHVVATRWGFPRAAEFTRAFRAAYGVSPSEHRQSAE